MRALIDELSSINVPLGYQDAPVLWSSAWWRWFATKVPGLLVTILAASLGAPFWFDVLQKVTKTRASGKPPQQGTPDVPGATAPA